MISHRRPNCTLVGCIRFPKGSDDVQLKKFIGMLKQLEKDVPVTRSSEVLLNGIKGPKSYDLIFHVALDDEAGYRAYMSQPKHIPAMKYVDEICDGIADVDVLG